MKLIVGLGNPGGKYANNRHNLGFLVVDFFAHDEGLSWQKSLDWICYFAKSQEFVVIKPTTFMNKSGEAVREVANFFKIGPDSILIVHDDLDLPFGKLRLSFDGMSAGHMGVESVIESLGGADFARLRIGIDHPEDIDPEKYVLEGFDDEEKKRLPKVLSNSCEAIRSFLKDGIQATMNRFN